MAQDSDFHGLLVLDKPKGMTSRAVVNHVQRWFPPRTRIGHTGTLDPLATGVLVLCVGEATRLVEYVQRMPKSYRARLRLGARSDTDDAEGKITQLEQPGPPPDPIEVAHCLQQFVGAIAQVPPAFSAAHTSGRRAYELARRGKEVSLDPRRVTIYRIELLTYEYPHLEIEVDCGKGTYIRSLARDLGEKLGCGAYVEELRRARVGSFAAARAVALESDVSTALSSLLPLAAAVAELPAVILEEAALRALRQGQAVDLPSNPDQPAPPAAATEMAIFNQAGLLAAIAILESGRTLHPTKVLKDPAQR
ncbi:MAG: tRNA pseudouridine(55) synthase TruB [Planctomycetota bacterium]|nr:MAG: tRNA pseudouridine(55) synthase TruB [Planctomycetota bacterium]